MEKRAPITSEHLEEFLNEEYQRYLERARIGSAVKSRATFGEEWKVNHGLATDGKATFTLRHSAMKLFKKSTNVTAFLDGKSEEEQPRESHMSTRAFHRGVPLSEEEESGQNEPIDPYWDEKRFHGDISPEEEYYSEVRRREDQERQEEQEARWREQGLLPTHDSFGNRIRTRQQQMDDYYGETKTDADRDREYWDNYREREYGPTRPPDYAAGES